MCIFLSFLRKLLFIVSRSVVTLCAAMVFSLCRCTCTSSPHCCRAEEQRLRWPLLFLLSCCSTLASLVFKTFALLPFSSFHASNTAPCFRISLFLVLSWFFLSTLSSLQKGLNSVHLVFKSATIPSCPKDHISLLCSSFPLYFLSASFNQRGAALASSPFLSPTTFIFFLASCLKHTY